MIKAKIKIIQSDGRWPTIIYLSKTKTDLIDVSKTRHNAIHWSSSSIVDIFNKNLEYSTIKSSLTDSKEHFDVKHLNE